MLTDPCPCGHRVTDHDAYGCLPCDALPLTVPLAEPCTVDLFTLQGSDHD